MPIAPPAAAISLAPGVAGNPTGSVAGMVALTAAELADEITAALLEFPTTEPIVPNLPWWDSGTLKKSAGIPPAFTLQPVSVLKDAGQTATFTITATNAVSYQWELQAGGVGSWSAISGATSAAYTTPTIVNGHNGNKYRCVVTGLGGSTTSTAGTLSIYPRVSYQVRGWSDSNYFAGGSNLGLAKLGTVRLVFKLLSLPGSSQKVICGRSDNTGTNGGWYIATAPGGVAATIAVSQRTAGGAKFSPTHTFTAADVGLWFILHATSNGSFLRMYIQGLEAGTGTATGGAELPARTGDQLWIGRFQHGAGLSAPEYAVVSLCTSTAVMTEAEIQADAALIQELTGPIRMPDLPSQADRFDADDIVAVTNWVSDTGSLTLTRNGTVTLEAF